MKYILAKDTDTYYINGIEKYIHKDFIGAIDDYNKSIEINPKHPWAYNGRGEAKQILNDLTGAIADYSISIENYPTHGAGYVYRGYAMFKIGEKDRAHSDWNKAGELGEKDAYYLIKLFFNNEFGNI